MITFSIIQKSKLEGAQRMDAEYFQPEFLNIENKLSGIKTQTIADISESVVNFGAYSLCNFIQWEEKGIPYLNVQDIKDGYIDFDNIKFISDKVDEILKKSRVTEGQIIMTMAGTIGNVAVAHKIPKKVNSNQATAKITLKKYIYPYYIAAFFNSYYGKNQIIREIVSSIQPNIFLFQIKNFKVPIVSENVQKEIEDIYKRGLSELENSKNYYQQAEDLLLEELRLKNFDAEENPEAEQARCGASLSTVVNLSEVQSAGRIDAEYFQGKYKRTIEIVRNKFEIKNLSEIFDFRRGIFVSTDYYSEVKNKTPYIRIKELPSKGSINKGEVIYINDKYKGNENDKIQENDLIIAIIGDTIGKAGLVDKELNGGFCSNNTGRLRIRKKSVDKFIPEFNELLFQSVFIQKQIEQKKAQTGQPKINDNEIRLIKIPILPKAIQQKIAELVQKSHESRKKAKELLEEAKRKVEKMIDGN